VSTPVAEAPVLHFRLSPQQRRLWLLQEGRPDAPFRVSARVAVTGPLRAEALERALAAVVERHEILRTRFAFIPAVRLPVQAVDEAAGPPLPEEDWSGLDEGERTRRGDAWMDPAEHPPFAYEQGPLLEALLVRVGADRHLLFLSLPALCADEGSLPVLVRDLARACAGEGGDEPAVQYADVADVLNDLLESGESEAGRDVWRQRDLAATGQPRLAALEGADGGRGFAPASLARPLPAEAAARLAAFAAAEGVAEQAVLLAAWQALLARLSGEVELTLGVACDGRVFEGLDGAIGPFARTVPLACRVAPRGSFRAACHAAAEALADAHEWQDYYWQDPAGAPQRPGFHALGFEWQAWPGAEPAGGVAFALDGAAACTDRFALRLCAVRRDEGVRLELRHDAGAVDRAEVERIAARLELLLDDALARPDAPLGELALVPRAEGDAVRAALEGDAAAGLLEDVTLHGAFERQAARTPDREAVVAGGQSLTYAALDARANRLAHALRALGVGPEARVAVLLERSPELLVAILGVLKAGGAYVPMDPAYPPERLAYMAAEAGIRVGVTQASLAERLAGAPAVLRLDADAARLEALPADPPAVEVSPGNLAYVIYTSGSTGRPKGVMVQHRSAVHLARALERDVYAGHPAPLRVAMNAPAAFDASVKQWIQLLNGHTLCTVPEEDRLDPRRMAARLGEWGVDALDCTPTQLRGLLAAGLGGPALPAPALLLVGGEAVDPALWARLGELPATAAFNVYGPTEATVDATAARIEPGTAPTLGRPLANLAVRLLDGALRPVPTGVEAELCVAGPGVARGYLGQPARTAERFVPDALGAPGARMYRTGDLARLHADGRLEYRGRADGQVKVRGVRLELGEVEAVLMEHPGVAAAAAAVRDLGRGDEELVAWYVPRPGAEGDALQGELRAALRARLPEFLAPSLVVPLAGLPRTSSGKVDRGALPDPRPLAAPPAAHVAPRGELEETLAGLWSEVLGVERVGVHDRFFELGGNSLLIVQVYDRLVARLGERITLVELFQYPTIAELAERLGREASPGSGAVSAVADAEARAARQREAMERRRRSAGES